MRCGQRKQILEGSFVLGFVTENKQQRKPAGRLYCAVGKATGSDSQTDSLGGPSSSKMQSISSRDMTRLQESN